MASFQDISTLNFMRGSFFRWTTRAIVRAPRPTRVRTPRAQPDTSTISGVIDRFVWLLSRWLCNHSIPLTYDPYTYIFKRDQNQLTHKTPLNSVTLNFPRFIYTNDNNAQFSNNFVLSISSRGGRNLICSFCVVALTAASADGDHSVHFYFYVVNQSLRVMNVDLCYWCLQRLSKFHLVCSHCSSYVVTS